MKKAIRHLAGLSVLAVCAAGVAPAMAQDTIKLGLSVPLSGAAAPWGIGSEWLCNEAAKEIAEAGGVKVKGKTYQFQCVTYDNKYNAAEGAKVAQALVNKDGVKFIAGSVGTAPVRALQSLTERKGVLLMTSAWGKSLKGPKFPLTFTAMNTSIEIAGPLTKYVAQKHVIKTVALLNPNDATGQETEKIARAAWEAAGVKVVASDWYQRGNSEFQPVAAKLSELKPDAIDLCSTPPGDSGLVFKALAATGWNGVKVVEVGTGAEGLLATGGSSVDGTYLGAALALSGPGATDHQRALNEGVKKATGDSINAVQLSIYDGVNALKAGIEKAQSLDPKVVAKALPTIHFQSFYGPSGFGGASVYGTPEQMLLPVIVTQLRNGKLEQVTRLSTYKN